MNDEEILLRHLHKVVGDYVEMGEKRSDERLREEKTIKASR
jgi:carnitine monooxygenase subunit